MLKRAILSLFLLASPALANDIYIEQVGDNLDLDIIQDGQDNQIGNSTTAAVFAGDTMTFSITQTGNFNTIAATIKGNTYTGTWDFTGDYNSVDLLCDSTTAVNCETVTMNITTTGDNNDFTVYVGETADAENLIANFTVTGDKNIITSNIDGTNANVTLVVDNSASLATTSANSDEGNAITLDIDGNGDVLGNTVDLTVTGGGSTYNITQSGIYDNNVTATFDGDSQNVDITQSD
jgi:hypothetical protein